MFFESLLPLLMTAVQNGLVIAVTVLALYLSYRMLNVCDLSTDGCYTLGACVSAVVIVNGGNPFLAALVAMCAGILSGFIVSILQTKMGVDSLLSGIIVNTALYSVNIAIMGGSSLINLNNKDTVFSEVRKLFDGIFGKSGPSEYDLYKIILLLVIIALIIVFLSLFLKSKIGLAIRATGDNPIMVKSSSINPVFTTVVGLCVANALTALSGCLMGQMNKSVTVDIGSGIVTIALASLLIGSAFISRRKISFGAVGAVFGAILFRLVYALALRLNMPAFMLKAISSIIVVIAIFIPYLKSKYPEFLRRFDGLVKRRKGNA